MVHDTHVRAVGTGVAVPAWLVWLVWLAASVLTCLFPAGPEAWSCDSCPAASSLSGGLCESVCAVGRYPLRKVSSFSPSVLGSSSAIFLPPLVYLVYSAGRRKPISEINIRPGALRLKLLIS